MEEIKQLCKLCHQLLPELIVVDKNVLDQITFVMINLVRFILERLFFKIHIIVQVPVILNKTGFRYIRSKT